MSYTLSQSHNAGDGAKQDELCTADYLQIPGNQFLFYNSIYKSDRIQQQNCV